MSNTDKGCPLGAVTFCDGPLNPSETTATHTPLWSYSFVIAFKLTERSSKYGGEISILEEGTSKHSEVMQSQVLGGKQLKVDIAV